MIHKLKIGEEYLRNILEGKKKSEIRLNDRDYQAGDTIEFWQNVYSELPVKHSFTITHIHSGLGLRENYVVLSIELKGE